LCTFIVSQHDLRGYTAADARGNADHRQRALDLNHIDDVKRIMKIIRNDPLRRRRRNPLTTLLIIAALIVVALFVVIWVRGGTTTRKPVEIAIPADQLGR
jgi:hypothetical protein